MPTQARFASLLDRLTLQMDGRPASEVELSEAQFRAAIVRDLRWLLNTTHLEALIPLEGLDLVRNSVLNYGVDSMTGRTASDVDEKEIAVAIRRAIATFEPRLRNVQVSAEKQAQGVRESIVLTIHAELLVRPIKEVHFRGVLDLDRNGVSLEHGLR
jgi:type VI secretion system protein ImpF